MLNVFLTVDVELWPDSWDLSPRRFSEYFRRYIHGSTATGDYGLPFQLRLLAEHDLKGVFFVESLFACEFGIESLRRNRRADTRRETRGSGAPAHGMGRPFDESHSSRPEGNVFTRVHAR